MGGWLNDFRSRKGVDGRICMKCGNSLERHTDVPLNRKDDKDKESIDGSEEGVIDDSCDNDGYICNDPVIPFRKATLEEIEKTDKICMDIIEYMEEKYGDLAVNEIYMILQNLVRSFEDFTKSAYGRTIKVVRNDNIANSDYDDVMYG